MNGYTHTCVCITLNPFVSVTQILGIKHFRCLHSDSGSGWGGYSVLLLSPSCRPFLSVSTLVVMAYKETGWVGEEWLRFQQPAIFNGT